MLRCLCLLVATILITFSNSAVAGTVSGSIVIEVDLSAHDVNAVAQLWIPYPITGKYQTITNIRVDGNYSSSGVYTDREFQTPMLHARWEPGAESRILSFSFDVSRQEVNSKPFPEHETAWDPADYAQFLAPTRLGPIDGEVRKLADQVTAGKTSVLDKAKAIYDWTCEHCYRDPDTRGCGIGIVPKYLPEPSGGCADISTVFVALARAAGVPARMVSGLRMGNPEMYENNSTSEQHCWAEFYLPGYGWVPVDPAEVREKILQQHLGPSSEETSDYREYYWGGVDGYRVRLSHGRDLILNPPQDGQPVNYLSCPFAQIGERTLDWFSPFGFVFRITSKRLPGQ